MCRWQTPQLSVDAPGAARYQHYSPFFRTMVSGPPVPAVRS